MHVSTAATEVHLPAGKMVYKGFCDDGAQAAWRKGRTTATEFWYELAWLFGTSAGHPFPMNLNQQPAVGRLILSVEK